MKKTYTVVLAACAGLALVTPGFAKTDKAGRVPPSFSALDADASGEISQDEMRAFGAARFDRADTNGDGFLNADELEARGTERAKKRSTRMLKRFDTDEDGQISKAEMENRSKGRGEKIFARMDADDSGSISEEEFAAAQQKMKKRRKSH